MDEEALWIVIIDRIVLPTYRYGHGEMFASGAQHVLNSRHTFGHHHRRNLYVILGCLREVALRASTTVVEGIHQRLSKVSEWTK
jgi:hypothetical protein